VTSLTSIVWYLWNLVNAQLYVFPFLFVLAGIVFLFVSADSQPATSFQP
jgi:hypothetical protein